MSKGKCDNCGHKTGGKFLGLQHGLNYFQCKKCNQRFCSKCKKSGPSCPKCGNYTVRKIGQLGIDY